MATSTALRNCVRALVFPRFCGSNVQIINQSPRIRWVSTETRTESNDASKTGTAESQTHDNGKPDQKAEASTQPNDIDKKYQEEKAKLETQIKDITDKYKRALAETENVRSRFQKQLTDSKLYSIQGFCKDLLEVADILNAATTSIPKEELEGKDVNPHLKSLYEGLTMTETQLQKVFGKNKLNKIDPEGEKFDPNFHEAMFEVPMEGKEPGTVAVVTKIGYKLHDRTIRPALVGVVKAT